MVISADGQPEGQKSSDQWHENFKIVTKLFSQDCFMNQTVEDIHEYVSDNIQSVKNQMNQFEAQNSFATGDFADPKE